MVLSAAAIEGAATADEIVALLVMTGIFSVGRTTLLLETFETDVEL